ncbi:general substrate transporter, partial [Fragilariopsis cylindrus CCMP1102]
LALVFLAPALGGFLYGYDIGATSFVLSMMLADRDHDNWWHKFPKLQQGLFISSLAFGALIGSHIVLTFLVNSIGRRKEIRIAATLYIVGAMLNVMSGTILATTRFGWGFTSLLMGRLLYGAGVGFIMHGAPTYMAEMSPSNVRGALVSAKETVIVFGIVVGMLMGDLQSDYPANWTDLYGYSILFAVPMLILTFKMPRSQRWLLLKGYHEEAKESMQFVYKGNVEDEFEKMADSINNICCRGESINDDDDEDDDDVPGSLCSKKYRNIMVIGMGLLLAQQFSGQPCVLAYSRVLFEAAGWGGHTSIITVTIMGVVSSFTVSMVDRLGRKTLLAAGSTIMLISVSCLSYGFWGWDENSSGALSDTKKQIVLWSMLVFISGYQIGFGPISWTVLSEIYPTEIRGSAMALSVEVNFFAKFLTQFSFPIIQGMIGWGTTFVVFACIILLGLIFIIFKVPETKGMTLEEIQLKL